VSSTREAITPDGPLGLCVAEPDAPPRGGVVVVQEAFGITPHIASIVDRLAGHGYLAAAPHLFHRTGDPVIDYGGSMAKVRPHMGALTSDGLANDVDGALDFLRAEGLEDTRLAIVGFCMGGTVALATGARLALGAAASFYGAGVREGRFGYPPLLESAPRLRTPWIGFYGEEDQGIPVEQAEALRQAAAQAAVPTELHLYPGAGHGFNCDDRDAYHAPAAADAWARMLAWFEAHLSPTG
jgi:carboxymethylenebutenolidase